MSDQRWPQCLWEQADSEFGGEYSGLEFQASIEVSPENSSLKQGWSYGYRKKDDKETWFRKSPDGEWEEIAADSPEAIAFKAMIFQPTPVVFDNFDSC